MRFQAHRGPKIIEDEGDEELEKELPRAKSRHEYDEDDDDDEEYDDGEEYEEEYDDEDEYDDEEEYDVHEEAEEGLYYDFLNIPFDEPTRAVKGLGKKLVGMSLRLLLSVIILAGAGYVTFGTELFGLPGLPEIEGTAPGFLKNAALAGFTVVTLFLAWETFTAGLWRLFKLRPTLDSMVVFSSAVSAVHSVMLAMGKGEGSPLGFISCLCCTFALASKRLRASNLRRVYKCMEISADPAAVKLTGGRKERIAIKTYTNAVPETEDAGGMDLTEKSASVFAPIAIVASVALAFAASFGAGHLERFVWALAIISSVTAPIALSMSSVRPWNEMCIRDRHKDYQQGISQF